MHNPLDDDETDKQVPRWFELAFVLIICGFVGAMLFSIVEGHL